MSNVNSLTSIYAKAVKPVDETEAENASFFKSKFNLEVTKIDEKLPNIY